MIKLEEKVFQLGIWNNVDALEDNLTLNELHRLFLASQEKEHNERMFAASLKGITLDPWKDPDEPEVKTFEQIKEEAARKAAIANGEMEEDIPTMSGDDGFGFEIVGED